MPPTLPYKHVYVVDCAEADQVILVTHLTCLREQRGDCGERGEGTGVNKPVGIIRALAGQCITTFESPERSGHRHTHTHTGRVRDSEREGERRGGHKLLSMQP